MHRALLLMENNFKNHIKYYYGAIILSLSKLFLIEHTGHQSAYQRGTTKIHITHTTPDRLLTLSKAFYSMVWNSVLIFHESLLYVSRVSNHMWTPASSWMLCLHCHENTVRVLCFSLSPSGWRLKDGRGQIMSPTSLAYQNKVKCGCEETQELTPPVQSQLCTIRAGSGIHGGSWEPTHSHELPNNYYGEGEDSAKRSPIHGGLGQPLQGPWHCC